MDDSRAAGRLVAIIRPTPAGEVELIVRGDVDVATVPVLRERFEEAARDLPARDGAAVIIDLTAIDFIDARGLGFLADLADGDTPIRVRVAQRTRRLLEIVDLSGLPIDGD